MSTVGGVVEVVVVVDADGAIAFGDDAFATGAGFDPPPQAVRTSVIPAASAVNRTFIFHL
jgi:hypothetical protein